MSDYNLTPGETLAIDFGPVARIDRSVMPYVVTPIDLTAVGTSLRFLVRQTDTSLVVLHYDFANSILAEGISVDASGDKNTGKAVVGDDVTAAWPSYAYLPWELELTEGAPAPINQRVTRVASGWIITGKTIA